MTDTEFEVMFQSIREDWPSEFYIRGPGAGYGHDVDQSVVDAVGRHMQAAASPTAVEAFERKAEQPPWKRHLASSLWRVPPSVKGPAWPVC